MKRWFDVTITESYHKTYKIYAEDEREADDIANTLVNNGDIDPTGDGGESYDRETDIIGSSEPEEGEDYWSEKDIEED